MLKKKKTYKLTGFLWAVIFTVFTTGTVFPQINQAIVIVNLNQPPTSFYVYKAPLKYNKKFAMSMQIDDGTDDIYTHAFPVFEGGTVNGVTYPGITYTDGCGNEIHFKMSSSVYSFNGTGDNGPDVHLPGNGYGKVSWPQMDTMYKNDWGILNHGVNGNSNVDPIFIDYSIKRNQSYIRRQLYETTDGGVITHLFVNPDGHYQWTQPAFDLGYRGALNQNNPSPLSEHGGNVNDPNINWTQPQNLYRVIAEDINVPAFAQALADSSSGTKHYWGAMFTHSVVYQYSFANFVSDFTTIGNLYGTNGQDNIFMATDEEILDYLLVRDTINMNYALAGSSIIITFTGNVPHDLRYYALSLVVESNTTIQSISVSGIDSVTYNGIGSNNALINLNWDEYVVTPPEVLADSFTTIAVTSNAQYDCWIAEDYVVTMENGDHKDSLRQLLCAVPNTVYDSGFCFCSISLDQDTTLAAGQCDTLYGPEGDYTYQWIVADTLYDTTQNIYVCPDTTTVYHLIATNSLGCPAEDSITVTISFLSIDLGADTTVCSASCVDLSGPPGMASYEWFVADTLFDTVQTVTICPLDTTQVVLNVTDTIGSQASDTIMLNTYPVPECVLQQDTVSVCPGIPADFFVSPATCSLYIWSYGTVVDTSQYGHLRIFDTDSSLTVHLKVLSEQGCSRLDSAYLNVYPPPEIVLSNDTTVCWGDSVTLSASGAQSYLWRLNGDSISNQPAITVVPPQGNNNYVVFVTSELGCTYSDTVSVTALPAPNVKIIYDTNTVCANSQISLIASGAQHYEWQPGGDTTESHTTLITDTTTFYLKGTNTNGCSAVDSLTIYTLPAPQVSFSGLLPAYCQNDPDVTLTGTPEEGTFAGAGINGNIFSPSVAGAGQHLILFTYTNTAGCMGIDSMRTTVYEGGDDILLSPADTTIYEGDSVILDAGPGFDNYYWSTGDTTQKIIIHFNDYPKGTYTFIVIGVINSCTSRGTSIITFSNPNGVEENSLPAMVVFPNPNNGSFSISYAGNGKKIDLSIKNGMGQTVFSKSGIQCLSGCILEIDLPQLKQGVYFIQLSTGKEIITKRIIVN
jgi:hypothetical protein